MNLTILPSTWLVSCLLPAQPQLKTKLAATCEALINPHACLSAEIIFRERMCIHASPAGPLGKVNAAGTGGS